MNTAKRTPDEETERWRLTKDIDVILFAMELGLSTEGETARLADEMEEKAREFQAKTDIWPTRAHITSARFMSLYDGTGVANVVMAAADTCVGHILKMNIYIDEKANPLFVSI